MSHAALRVIDAPPAPTRTRTVCGNWYVADDGSEWAGAPVKCGVHPVTLWPFWVCYAWLLTHVFFFVWQVAPSIPPSGRSFAVCVYVVLWGSSCCNFLLVYCTNPGLLPWNWSETRKRAYTAAELRSGIATTNEQAMWAKAHAAPNRAHFSRRLGWFVLRADHDCTWVNGWVGAWNHAHFVRAVAWGTLLLCFSMFWAARAWVRGAVEGAPWLFHLYVAASIALGGITARQTAEQSSRISLNRTTVEMVRGLWEEGSPYDRGCLANWEEIFGSRRFLPLWPCPVPIPGRYTGFEYGEGESEPLIRL
jgi:hypothetical protein